MRSPCFCTREECRPLAEAKITQLLWTPKTSESSNILPASYSIVFILLESYNVMSNLF